MRSHCHANIGLALAEVRDQFLMLVALKELVTCEPLEAAPEALCLALGQPLHKAALAPVLFGLQPVLKEG